jgi:hypothetical protein
MAMTVYLYLSVFLAVSRPRWLCCLRLLDSWDRSFEYRFWRGFSSVLFVVFCVGSGLCDWLITRPEQSYRLCVCLTVCDLETSTVRRPSPEVGCWVTERIISCGLYVKHMPYSGIVPFCSLLFKLR